MANKYRGVKWNNAGAGPKVKIRRSIWLAELQDFGAIADDAIDLPTAGAVHRAAYGGSKSGTREFVDLSTVNDLAVVDTQDHGLIGETATTLTVWPTLASYGGAITTSYSGVELDADYGLDFSPSNNHLEVAQADTSGWFGNSTGWSVELWIRHTSATITTADAIMGQFGNISLTSTSGGNQVVFQGNLGLGTEYIVESSNGINDTDWHHIHVGYDGTEVRMFIDGTEVGSMLDSGRNAITSIAVDDSNTTGDFLIGARENASAGSTSHYWDGEMADIHITSGSASHARTTNYDVDDIHAPESTDETKLLIYGTLTGWSNTTTTTVTEATASGGTTPIGFDIAQPWAGFSTSNIKYDGAHSFTGITGYSSPLSTAHYPHGLHWSPDGTKFFWMMLTGRVVQATVSTAWDITSTVDIDNHIIDFSTAYTSTVTGGHNSVKTVNGTVQSDQASLFWFDPTGTRLYVYGSTYYSLGQYDLTAPWDLTGGMTWKGGVYSRDTTGETVNAGWTLKGSAAGFSSSEFYGHGFHWIDDGNKLLLQRQVQAGGVYILEFSTPYDITSFTGTVGSATNSQTQGSYGITGDTDGDGLSDVADVYNLAFGQGFHFNHNGTELYRVHRKFDHTNYDGGNASPGNGLNGHEMILVRATLSTPYDVTTMSYASQADLTGLTQNSTGPTHFSPSRSQVYFHPNGKKFWVFGKGWTNNVPGATGDSNFAENDTHILQYTIG